MPKLIFAFCTYNRADRLEKLVATMRAQTCLVPFEILAVNNSTDNTENVLAQLDRPRTVYDSPTGDNGPQAR